MTRSIYRIESRRSPETSIAVKRPLDTLQAAGNDFCTADPVSDRLADEFRSCIKQTECHLARLEHLLRRIA